MVKVDSILKYQIGYEVDSTTNKIPIHKWDPEERNGMPPTVSSLPPNPMTLILLDSNSIELKELNKYNLSNVDVKRVYLKNDTIAMALYGTRAKNGLIILKSKE